jgi:type IV pilus assembly protein PilM
VGGAGETVAMCHIGDHTSYVVIAVDGIPRFVRIIPIDIETGAVRARRGQEAAESIDVVEPAMVLETVPPQPQPEGQALRGRAALRAGNGADPVVSDLVGRLRNTISFYANRPDTAPATSVFLSGAGSAAPGVVQAMTMSLDANVRVLSSSDLLRTKRAGAVDDVELDLNLVSTVGLALGEGY